MGKLRTQLVLLFAVATVLPFVLTAWVAVRLLHTSLDLSRTGDLSAMSQTLEETGRELYRQSREALQGEAREHPNSGERLSPVQARAFWDSGEAEQFELAGDGGYRLDYYLRMGDGVRRYSRPLGVKLDAIKGQIAGARSIITESSDRDLLKGFSLALVAATGVVWLAALGTLIYVAHRISDPVRALTTGLSLVARGDLSARVATPASGEVGQALAAFNEMAERLERARGRLIEVTRIASWQSVARKMAHEVKNSLTPIRLTMEEVASRGSSADSAFLEQASQIVIDEVAALERRVRAFSEFASEPPVSIADLDVNGIVEERVAFLKSAHPGVVYRLDLDERAPVAKGDPDLVRGVLTNLLENAAHAAGTGGVVLARTAIAGNHSALEVAVHDSGPGLSREASATLFEPSISYKKGGMGLGLSIARRAALLCGGDLRVTNGELGGAAFALELPQAASS